MKATPLEIPDVIIIEPEVFRDERGFFFESFNQVEFEKTIGQKINFVQDNQSRSKKGVLRGLHYQIPPKAQAKLVRVILGEIFDVAIDIRKSSPTFGKWVSQILSSENKKQMWIPEGFAHGFITLSEHADILYKTTEFYSVQGEQTILWDDKTLDISWPICDLFLSPRDRLGKNFNEVLLFD